MKQIEFFGVSSSGKTYLSYLIKKEHINSRYIYSYKEIVAKYLAEEEIIFVRKFYSKFI